MATVLQLEMALPSYHILMASGTSCSNTSTVLSGSKPNALWQQEKLCSYNDQHGKRKQAPAHRTAGPSTLRMRAAFLLELENTHFPAKTLRQLEHRINPFTRGSASFLNTGYHDYKIVDGDSRLRKSFLQHLEVTNLDAQKLRRLEERIGPSQEIVTANNSMSHKPSVMPSATMGTQEESSAAAHCRVLNSNCCEDLQNPNVETAKASEVSCFKAHPTTEICKLHEVYYSSQYTRPASELLTEVLAERYPVQKAAPEDGQGDRPTIDGESIRQKCAWLFRLATWFGRT